MGSNTNMEKDTLQGCKKLEICGQKPPPQIADESNIVSAVIGVTSTSGDVAVCLILMKGNISFAQELIGDNSFVVHDDDDQSFEDEAILCAGE
eukprot:9496709-Ditylum_brightwellii.AAC.1